MNFQNKVGSPKQVQHLFTYTCRETARLGQAIHNKTTKNSENKHRVTWEDGVIHYLLIGVQLNRNK